MDPDYREQHSRSKLRYATDLTGARGLPQGRPRLRSMRESVNGIFYVLRGGISWRVLAFADAGYAGDRPASANGPIGSAVRLRASPYRDATSPT